VDTLRPTADTDYVAAATPGDLDLYAMGNLSFTPDTVHAVQLTMVARKDDAEARQVRTKLKSGTTTADGTTPGHGDQLPALWRPVRDRSGHRHGTWRGQRHAGRHRGGELMAENRVTTVLVEILSSGGQSQALTTIVVVEVLSSIAEAAPASSGGPRPVVIAIGT
jgi:hypothetical protein